jgi:hypothetical protein
MNHKHPHAPDSIEARAHRRVRRKMGLFAHAAVFVAVNLGLGLKHWLSGHPGHLHLLWGWGVGLAIHGAVVWLGLHSEGLRERLLRQEIERMRRESGSQGPGGPGGT